MNRMLFCICEIKVVMAMGKVKQHVPPTFACTRQRTKISLFQR